MFMCRGRVPAAVRVPLLRARRPRHRAVPDDLDERTSSSWTAATSTAPRPTSLKRDDAHILNIDHHHDNTRFGTVNHVVPDGLVHRRDRVGPHARARRRADARDRRRALRRPGHRHRQVHVREHRHARARDGRRADRGRRRRPRHLPAPVRGHARTPSSSCSAAALANVAALRRRPADDHPPARATTSAWPAPRRATPRASSTTCAPSRARRSPRSSRELPSDAGSGPQEGLAARRPTATSTSRAIAARRRRRRPPPGRGLHDGARPTTSSSRSCATQSPRSSTWRASDGAAWTASSSSTSPPARPRTTSSPRCAASCAQGRQGRARGHARPVRDRAAARPGRAGDAGAALPDGAAEDLRDGRAARRDVDDRRPGGRDRADRRRAARPARPADRGRCASARRPTAR